MSLFNGWAVTPQVGQLLIATLHKSKPRIVVECGSGLSTLLLGYALQKIGSGKVFSLEHDGRHARQTRSFVQAHCLTKWVQVIHAPLAVTTLNEIPWKWYDLRNLKIRGTIDLLFIDGPPGNLQARSRYPAGPLLFRRVSDDGLVILDDAHRQDERAIVKRWLREFPEFKRHDRPARPIPRQAVLLKRMAQIHRLRNHG